MKLHEIMISGLFATVILVTFTLWYANMSLEYDVTGQDYTHTANINNSLANINAKAERAKTITEGISGLPFGLDVLGGVLVGGFTAISAAGESYDILHDIFQDSNHYLPIGEISNTLMLFAGGALLIIIFIAILGHYISKSERV